MSHDRSAPAAARSIFVEPTEEELIYFGMVDRAVATLNKRVISNSRPGHAVYILCKLLEMAYLRVSICTGHLRRTFDGVKAYAEPKLAELAVKFLQRGGELGIVILETPDVDPGQTIRDHPLLATLSNADIGAGKVTVGHLQDAESEPPFHFVAVDGRALRVEINPQQAEAYAKLSDLETCAVLDRLFESQMRRSRRLLSLPAA